MVPKIKHSVLTSFESPKPVNGRRYRTACGRRVVFNNEVTYEFACIECHLRLQAEYNELAEFYYKVEKMIKDVDNGVRPN